jgi:hypothetical protein
MATVTSSAASAFVDALVARDFARAAAQLHPEVDFRAMTPRRIWDPEGLAGVEEVLRTWFEDPAEEIEWVEATLPVSIANTVRVGWLVRLHDADGPRMFEQQAYVRERDGRIGWMRVVCTGKQPLG